MTKNPEHRQMVLDYIKNYNIEPLTFVKAEYRVDPKNRYYNIKTELPPTLQLENDLETLSKIEDLTELTLKVLKLTEIYWSKRVTDNFLETPYGKIRSALDIWRHVKYYKPDTTIFQIMKILWDNRENLRYQYCTVVCRRVFNIRGGYHWGQYNSYTHDEFGLIFRQWGSILNK